MIELALKLVRILTLSGIFALALDAVLLWRLGSHLGHFVKHVGRLITSIACLAVCAILISHDAKGVALHDFWWFLTICFLGCVSAAAWILALYLSGVYREVNKP
jgi:hypothetical protein